MKKYVCLECGWMYEEENGLPSRGIPPGTRWASLPDDFKCEECEVRKRDINMWQELD